LQCVAPIRELIKIFEGRKYITISYLIFGIQKSLYLINNIPATNSKGNISETMQEFKNTLIKELEERFPITDLNSLALALDPFVYSQDICADEFNNLQKEWVDIKKESLELPNENYEKRFPKKETDKNEENANLVVPKKKYDTSSLKTSFFLNSPIKTASPYVDELSQYEKIINKSDLFAEYPNGILEFWNKNRIIFPNLSFLAIEVLAIPVSSADCESIASICGNILTEQRSTMNQDLLFATCFLKFNENFLKKISNED